jgi:hypothetical protein
VVNSSITDGVQHSNGDDYNPTALISASEELGSPRLPADLFSMLRSDGGLSVSNQKWCDAAISKPGFKIDQNRPPNSRRETVHALGDPPRWPYAQPFLVHCGSYYRAHRWRVAAEVFAGDESFAKSAIVLPLLEVKGESP